MRRFDEDEVKNLSKFGIEIDTRVSAIDLIMLKYQLLLELVKLDRYSDVPPAFIIEVVETYFKYITKDVEFVVKEKE